MGWAPVALVDKTMIAQVFENGNFGAPGEPVGEGGAAAHSPAELALGAPEGAAAQGWGCGRHNRTPVSGPHAFPPTRRINQRETQARLLRYQRYA